MTELRNFAANLSLDSNIRTGQQQNHGALPYQQQTNKILADSLQDIAWAAIGRRQFNDLCVFTATNTTTSHQRKTDILLAKTKNKMCQKENRMTKQNVKSKKTENWN